MIQRLKNSLQGCWQLCSQLASDEGLRKLYASRQALRPTEGNRTQTTILFSVVILFILFSSLASLVWVQRSESYFIQTTNGIAVMEADAIQWTMSRVPASKCGLMDLCKMALRSTSPVFIGTNLSKFDLGKSNAKVGSGRDDFFMLSARFEGSLWHDRVRQDTDAPLVLSLPGLVYEQATLFVNGVQIRNFYNSEALVATVVQSDSFAQKGFYIELQLKFGSQQSQLLRADRRNVPTFIAEQFQYQRYADLIAAKRSGAGKQLADIARIVLAVFSIFLFVFIDSSPECLGLAVFMGLKAMGVILAQSWLPDSWASANSIVFLRSFLLCFGDVMQLYFMTQLARLSAPKIRPWLIGGVIFSLAYTLGITADFHFLEISWTAWIYRFRAGGIGLLCLTVAAIAARYCFRHRMYSRGAALAVAISGTLVQIFYPILSIWPNVAQNEWFLTWYNVFEMHTPYVFALSVFINISTLEHRVKALSHQLVSAKELERDLALGVEVQQSFLKMPMIPNGLSVATYHEAANFVSGDIYFAHWDKEREIFSLLLTDVTGHGVQAALKASICSALAEGIFSDDTDGVVKLGQSPMQLYNQKLDTYLQKVFGEKEAASVVGVQLFANEQRMEIYRSNGTFPVLIQKTDESFSVTPMASQQAKVISRPFLDGSTVLLTSDGLIDGSRRLADFCSEFAGTLEARPEGATAEEIKEMALSYKGFSEVHDDRTLLVLQMKGFVSSVSAGARRKNSEVA